MGRRRCRLCPVGWACIPRVMWKEASRRPTGGLEVGGASMQD